MIFNTASPASGASHRDDNQYTIYLGDYSSKGNQQDTIYHRLVPGDLIIRGAPYSGHVAIVNYITGCRGETNPKSKYTRNDHDIRLIQSICNPKGDRPRPYNDKRLDGRVTDSWTWFSMFNNGQYHARRLMP